MTKNKTWAKLVRLRAEVLALVARYRDGDAIDIANELGRLESLARPHGRRHEIEKMIGDGFADAEIVKALGVKKQQANRVRQDMRANQPPVPA